MPKRTEHFLLVAIKPEEIMWYGPMENNENLTKQMKRYKDEFGWECRAISLEDMFSKGWKLSS